LTDAQQSPFPAAAQRARKSKRDSLLRGTTLQPGTPEPLTTPAQEPATSEVPTLGDVIPGAPAVVIPAPPKAVQDATDAQQAEKAQTKLLDYLLGA
jgi:hypothetical protein